MHLFFKFRKDLVDWNVENGQQGKNVLSNMLSKEIEEFFNRKLSGIDIERDKILKFFDFRYFCSIFVKISIDLVH